MPKSDCKCICNTCVCSPSLLFQSRHKWSYITSEQRLQKSLFLVVLEQSTHNPTIVTNLSPLSCMWNPEISGVVNSMTGLSKYLAVDISSCYQIRSFHSQEISCHKVAANLPFWRFSSIDNVFQGKSPPASNFCPIFPEGNLLCEISVNWSR